MEGDRSDGDERMSAIGDRLRDIAADAKSAGFKACADIVKRMARDVDAGNSHGVSIELESILSANYHRREPVDAFWTQAQTAVDGWRHQESNLVPPRFDGDPGRACPKCHRGDHLGTDGGKPAPPRVGAFTGPEIASCHNGRHVDAGEASPPRAVPCRICGAEIGAWCRAWEPAIAPPPLPTGPACLLTATGARACADVGAHDMLPLTDRPENVRCVDCRPIAARIIRERNRREIDALLAEDARLHPAFALARRAAVIASIECHFDRVTRNPSGAGAWAGGILAACHEHEAHRHERRDRIAAHVADPKNAGSWVTSYERSRPLCGRPT